MKTSDLILAHAEASNDQNWVDAVVFLGVLGFMAFALWLVIRD